MARQLSSEAGLRPFLEEWHLIPGEPWQEAIEEALVQSETVAVFVGHWSISPWHNEGMRAAVDHALRTRDECRVITVLLPGEDESTLTSFLLSAPGSTSGRGWAVTEALRQSMNASKAKITDSVNIARR